MSQEKTTAHTGLTDEELEAAQGGMAEGMARGMAQGITLDVEPNDTIQNARTARPKRDSSTFAG